MLNTTGSLTPEAIANGVNELAQRGLVRIVLDGNMQPHYEVTEAGKAEALRMLGLRAVVGAVYVGR